MPIEVLFVMYVHVSCPQCYWIARNVAEAWSTTSQHFFSLSLCPTRGAIGLAAMWTMYRVNPTQHAFLTLFTLGIKSVLGDLIIVTGQL